MKLLFKLYNNVYNKEFKRIPILYLYIMYMCLCINLCKNLVTLPPSIKDLLGLAS